MKGGKRRVSSPPPGASIFNTSAPRSPRFWVANGPASTRVRSMTRIPSSGPAQPAAPTASGSLTGLLRGAERLFRRGDHDLDQHLRARQIGPDAGPGRRVLRIDPLVPHRVHVAEEG